MRKQQKQMIFLLVLLILLGGGYLGLRRYNQLQSQKPAEETGEVLVSLASEELMWFSYEYEGVEYAYEKDGDVWYYAADSELTLRQTALLNIADGLCNLIAQDTISGVTDPKQYGLAEPSGTFSFGSATGTYEFCVGDYNEIMDTYYICCPGETIVYTVPASAITVMELDVMDIVEEDMSETVESSEVADSTDSTLSE